LSEFLPCFKDILGSRATNYKRPLARRPTVSHRSRELVALCIAWAYALGPRWMV